jgi:hypothetical protein
VTAQTPRPTTGTLRAAVRRFSLGSGPVKRRSDRVQVAARLLVVLAFLCAPSLAVLTATKTAGRLQAVAATQTAERSRTTAVTDADAPPAGSSTPAGEYVDESPGVPAHWTGPSGADRDGRVPVLPGTPAGTAVPVWVDRQGDLTEAPMSASDVQSSAMGAALLPLFGVPAGAVACYAALCAALDARRDRRWTDGWAAVEPAWKAQLH